MGGRRFSREGKSFYAELGVSKDANEEEISRAYRKLALRHHPDKNPGRPEALDKFKEINRIHKVLLDPTRRQIYDKYGSIGLNLADKRGIEDIKDIKFLMLFKSWWFWVCFALLGIFSCLYCCLCCCCCCNCCCGRYCQQDENEEDFPKTSDLEGEMEEIQSEVFVIQIDETNNE